MSAFEKAKKKYVVKLKKMETQMQLMNERHESQVSFTYCGFQRAFRASLSSLSFRNNPFHPDSDYGGSPKKLQDYCNKSF